MSWLRAVAFLLLCPVAADAFVCITSKPGGPCVHWDPGVAPLQTFLGDAGGPFLNGTQSWNENVVNAAADWTAVGAAFQFTVTPGQQFTDPCAPDGSGIMCGPAGYSPVFFTPTACGAGFGDIIAQAVDCFGVDSGKMINAPVFVNSTVNLNAFDGPLRPQIHDIRRVLLHELGHVLGLDHPDLNGQTVDAIMNSRESDLDRLQADDRAGILSLYPSTTTCIGDCSIRGSVTPVDLLTLVQLALRGADASACQSGDVDHDGLIRVHELLAAVDSARSNCPAPTA